MVLNWDNFASQETLGVGVECYNMHWVEARDAVKHSAGAPCLPPPNYLTQNVTRAETKKSWSIVSSLPTAL